MHEIQKNLNSTLNNCIKIRPRIGGQRDKLNVGINKGQKTNSSSPFSQRLLNTPKTNELSTIIDKNLKTKILETMDYPSIKILLQSKINYKKEESSLQNSLALYKTQIMDPKKRHELLFLKHEMSKIKKAKELRHFNNKNISIKENSTISQNHNNISQKKSKVS